MSVFSPPSNNKIRRKGLPCSVPKILASAVLLGSFLALNGCGGSSSSSPNQTNETDQNRFQATLPDGSAMALVILGRENGTVAGSFAIAGEDANQAGSFLGTASGNAIDFKCETPDGKEFTLSGSKGAGETLTLTRSDLPGQPLTFRPLAELPRVGSRSPVSFLLTTGGTNGRVTIESEPASKTTSGTTIISEHKGTWAGVPVIFWAYSSGTANLTVYIDPMCVSSQIFANYRLADFGTKTIVAGSGQMTMYSSVTRSQIKYKVIPTASP